MKKLLALVLILGIAYFAYTRFTGAPGGMGGMPGGGAPPVSAAEVIARDVQLWQEFSGRLVAVDSAEIRPQVSGLIEKVHFTDGELVKKGQLLFTIEQKPYQAALAAAQARETWAKTEMTRATALLADKAVPQREYDERKNNYDVARADLARAKVDYEYTLIRAPIAGRVSRAEITEGNLVQAGPGAPLLTTVVADRPIYADFDIDERSFLQYLQDAGTDVEKLKSIPIFLGLSGQDPAIPGRVQSFDNRLDVRSGTLRVRAIFDNEEGKLIPGLFARVRIGKPEKTPAILITDRAIGTDQSKKFVIAVGEEGKTERREIKLGGMADGLRVVTEGLKPGDKIIVSGLQRVMMPGQPVMPEMVPMEGQGSGGRAQEPGEEKVEEKTLESTVSESAQ